MKKLFWALMVTGSGLLAAEPILKIDSIADLAVPPVYKKSFINGAPGEIHVVGSKRAQCETVKRVKIDPNKKYKLSFEARKAPTEATPTYFWIGFVPYTAQGNPIGANAVNFSADIMGELAAPAVAGTTKVLLKNAAKWSARQGYECIAFNAKKDLSDLPNLDTSPFIKSIEHQNGLCEVTLKSKLRKSYPAGTVVRNHRSGATYLYAFYGFTPKNWQSFSHITAGDAGKQARANNRWWVGTDSVRIVIFTRGKGGVQIRNWRLEEL